MIKFVIYIFVFLQLIVGRIPSGILGCIELNHVRTWKNGGIVGIYRKFANDELQPGVVEDKYAYVATPDEIRENDYNLNIPRYVDTYEEEAEIDITAVQKEIDQLETELAEVQGKMKEYLKELGY